MSELAKDFNISDVGLAQRRRAIAERARQEDLKRQENERRRHTELVTESEQWERANLLKRYVRRIKQSVARETGRSETWPALLEFGHGCQVAPATTCFIQASSGVSAAAQKNAEQLAHGGRKPRDGTIV